MQKFFFLLTGAALMFAGCAKVENENTQVVPEKGTHPVTLQATINNADTRVSADNNGVFAWQETDQISVITKYGSIEGELVFSNGITITDNKATFTFDLNEGQTLGQYAFYPAAEGCGVDSDGFIGFGLRHQLDYAPGVTNMPMLGTLSPNGASFAPVGGVIKLTVANVPSEANYLRFSVPDQKIAGTFLVDNGAIATEDYDGSDLQAYNYVDIIIPDNYRESTMEFYIPVPTGNLGNPTFAFYKTGQTDPLYSVSPRIQGGLVIERKDIIVPPTLDPRTVSDNVYAIAVLGVNNYGDIMMTAPASGNHQTYSPLGTDFNDGKLSVPAESAWRLVYNANSASYSIISMSNDLYLVGNAGSTNLKLDDASEKADFYISPLGADAQGNKYTISVGQGSNIRRIGFNVGNFGLYQTNSSYPYILRLIPAVVSGLTPSIEFEEEAVTVPSTATNALFQYTAAHLSSDPSIAIDEDVHSIVDSWTVNATNHQIIVTLVPNEDDIEKRATLTVTSSGVNPITLTIIQSAKSDTYEDVITRALTGVPNAANYKDWSGVSYSGGSGAEYTGNSAGDHDSVQLRDNSNSGIISTTSGGKVKKITVDWNSNTANGRVLDVYGKNTAYTAVSDLYDNSKQGTLLGTIKNGTSTELTISGDYEYIGLKSHSGAMYITEIKIDWQKGSGSTPTTYAVSWTNPTETGCSISATVGGNSIQNGDSFAEGTVVTIFATAGSGYTFGEWTISGADVVSASSTPTTFTVGTSPVSFSASFTSSGGSNDPITLFHETFGDNSGSARAWNDSYSVKSGISSVYSGITSYGVTNVKQGKNTTGSTASGLNQSTQSEDAIIIIGPLNVSGYRDLELVYQWKAASIKETYSTHLYYATSASGTYTEINGTGDGATTFVERAYSLPAAAQVSTLYLKIVWNTSNAQAIIDEVDLTGINVN